MYTISKMVQAATTRWRVAIKSFIGLTLLVSGLAWPQAGAAFDHTWFTFASSAPRGACDLWDDAPGAGTNNESGFFWVQTDTPGNEYCQAMTSISGKTSTSTVLSVKAAVNDYSRLTVEIRSGSEFCTGGHVVGSLSISGTEANSAFMTKTVSLPANEYPSEVCVTIDDHPDTVASQRASALIDEIRVWSQGCYLAPSDQVATASRRFTGRYLSSSFGTTRFAFGPTLWANGTCWRETFSAPY